MYGRVIWPERFDPRVSAIYALNEGEAYAPPETIWKLLIDATKWSAYFPPENDVTIERGGELSYGARFHRITAGYAMSLVVTEFEPYRRLAWATTVDGDDTGSSAYHGWVITPTYAGAHVLTEETQQGPFFVEAFGRNDPGGLFRYHQEWVERLVRAAEARAGRRSPDTAVQNVKDSNDT